MTTPTQIIEAINSIPLQETGSQTFYVFNDRIINVSRVLQIIPEFNTQNTSTGVYVVYTLDYSTLHASTVSI
jgi:hypothetical protein